MNEEMGSSGPSRDLPSANDEHYQLYRDVREAISSLPVYFRTETHISGIMATDLHTLNTVLGATIEEQVVRTLNLIRNTWDPHENYALYSFVRQAQTFPDVLLRRTSTEEILLGIELKGWYLLAKKAEPSLRFQATAAACAKRDLIAVVPWVLGNVISGSPILFEPYRPHSDGGGNFGRLARTGMMDSYVQKLDEVQLCGVKTTYWLQFLKAFQESTTDAETRSALERLNQRVRQTTDIASPKAQSALVIMAELERLLDMPE